MDQQEWETIVSSGAFRFTVGSGKRDFIMHSKLVASLSPPLKALVDGPMIEAQTCHVVWDDIYESTFVMFSQFAYTGDYTSVKPVQEEPVSIPGRTEGGEDSDRRPAKKAKVRAFMGEKQKRPWDRFFSASECHFDIYPRPMPEPRQYEDHSAVLLSHARLYILADRYQVSNLKALSLRRIAKVLGEYLLSERRCKDVLSLLRFCYDDEPVPDKVKEVVTLYMSCEMTTLWKSAEFKEFYWAHKEPAGAVMDSLLATLEG